MQNKPFDGFVLVGHGMRTINAKSNPSLAKNNQRCNKYKTRDCIERHCQ